jgi:predicted AAA+ superfamily ATPase
MAIGGFPEFVAHETKKYHQELFKDIVYRDIAVRNKIRNVQELTIIALHLINNMARPFTFNKLAKNYEIKSVNTVTNFVRFLEDSYLLFPLQRFDFSYRKQQVNEKKIYVIDHVLALQNSTQMHEDYGRILENMVFLEIRRNTKSVWYFKNKGETDFIFQWKGAYHAVQVCWELSAENNKREINGLKEAMESIELKSATVVTAHQEDEITVLDKTIKCVPFWKWEFPA